MLFNLRMIQVAVQYGYHIFVLFFKILVTHICKTSYKFPNAYEFVYQTYLPKNNGTPKQNQLDISSIIKVLLISYYCSFTLI